MTFKVGDRVQIDSSTMNTNLKDSWIRYLRAYDLGLDAIGSIAEFEPGDTYIIVKFDNSHFCPIHKSNLKLVDERVKPINKVYFYTLYAPDAHAVEWDTGSYSEMWQKFGDDGLWAYVSTTKKNYNVLVHDFQAERWKIPYSMVAVKGLVENEVH